MRFKKGSVITMTAAVAVIACLVWSSAATAETIPSNVALFQTVSIDSGTWTNTANLTNDLNDGTAGRVTCSSTLSGLWIDLGATYNVGSFYLGFNAIANARGAILRAYAAQDGSAIGSTYTVPSNADPILGYTSTVADWAGVRYIKITDEGSNPSTMTLRELRAFAPIETYPTFITGVAPTASSTLSGAADVSVNNLCNNAGMDDQRSLVGSPTAKSLTSGPFWQTIADTTTGWINFDLGAVRDDLDKMLIWNLNQTNQATRGIQHATIEYSTDGTTYAPLADTNGGDLTDGNYTIPIVTQNEQNAYSLAVDLTGIAARHVRITALDSYGGTNIGLSEVRIYAVPEPSVVALALAGLGLLLVFRRHKTR